MRTVQIIAAILALSVLLSLSANASEQKESWFCTDDQSMKTGNTYVICGVGTSDAEGGARTKALNSAVNEFKTICELSSDCSGHRVSVEPKRSSCDKSSIDKSGWNSVTCHRMFLFTVQ